MKGILVGSSCALDFLFFLKELVHGLLVYI